ncbi:MAG: single-stranded DNA-binding protein [bacterium]|nr:single-stranded DNA-binding protein [bacterium]
MNLNKAFIIGNLTRDPEIRQTAGGQAVCSFSVATNRFYTDNSGQKQKQAEFHNIVAWGKQAEIVNQYLKRGSLVMIEGRLQTRSWQDQQGAKHWKTEIVAERIQLGPRLSPNENPSSGWSGRDDNHGIPPSRPEPKEDSTPIIELPGDGEEVDIRDIPF